MAKPQLIIIPGLGDRGRRYRFFVPFWARIGFAVHIFVFGWEDSRVSFEDAQTRLIQFVDSLGTNVYVIGVSAGGAAAVNLLIARPDTVTKVVTVCTPYVLVPERYNRLLNKTSTQLVANLARLDSKSKAKIVSVHAAFDQLVPVKASQPAGIQDTRLRSIGHGTTIFAALVFYRQVLTRFLLS